MTKWALTVLLVLSAPIALYVGRIAIDIPQYVSEHWSQETLLSFKGLGHLFVYLIPALWILSALWVAVIWLRNSPDPPAKKLLNLIVGGLLLTFTALTALLIYVLWAWP
ncbi:hypothetical protein [Brevundimonas sp.]|uniref:hypothetical protein n=1 Tax=Brevundimonas sp. TaxID=1871086 RepID=UPI0025C50628|nr:hypothetical protein [Brevundimonas sp.]